MLTAVAAAAGVSVWALILRHWHTNGLLEDAPERPVAASRWLLGVGVLALAIGAGRQLALPETSALAPFVPLLGGVLELVCPALFWVGVLEAHRTARELRREWMLFAGMGLALLQPLHATWSWLSTWAP